MTATNTSTDDLLDPPFDSDSRKSTIVVATFNLVATIVGGGVLSLPFAFHHCGLVVGTIFMVLAAIITDRSLNLLCLSARCTGATSYGHVGRDAFGAWMDTAISMLLFVFLLFVLVAYMVLLRDTWTPIVASILGDTAINGDVVLLVIILLMSPFLCQKTLYSLRFNCYIGFASVSILCIALIHHAIMVPQDWSKHGNIRYYPESIGNALFAVPIIGLSFLATFNVLPIQNALVQPTRERMQTTITSAVVACFVLMYSFGVGGYLYAQEDTKGNILLNTTDNDVLLWLGRVGCGVTIMLALAMMMLPCRESLLEVVELLVLTCSAYLKNTEDRAKAVLGEQLRLLPVHQSPPPAMQDNPYIHYGSTLGIALVCYLGAVLAPGVAIVWSLCGSSMAFLIAFILPAACYLKLQTSTSSSSNACWKYFAWCLLILSAIAAVACTSQTVIVMRGEQQ